MVEGTQHIRLAPKAFFGLLDLFMAGQARLAQLFESHTSVGLPPGVHRFINCPHTAPTRCFYNQITALQQCIGGEPSRHLTISGHTLPHKIYISDGATSVLVWIILPEM